MTQATAPEQECEPGVRMTIHVYTVSSGSGEIVEDRGTIKVLGGLPASPQAGEAAL